MKNCLLGTNRAYAFVEVSTISLEHPTIYPLLLSRKYRTIKLSQTITNYHT